MLVTSKHLNLLPRLLLLQEKLENWSLSDEKLVSFTLYLFLVCLLLLGFFLQPRVFNSSWQKSSGQGTTISGALDETIQLGFWKRTWRVRTSRGWNMKQSSPSEIVWHWTRPRCGPVPRPLYTEDLENRWFHSENTSNVLRPYDAERI